MPGSFSGLHLLSHMYVGFQRIAPEVDTSIELREEYEAALKLFTSRREK